MLFNQLILGNTIRFVGLLIILNLALGSFPEVSRANETESSSSNYGMPTHRRDGGSRGDDNNCIAENRNLVALIPENTVAVTASASPQLFFYVPKTNKQQTLEFVLRDERDRLIYEAFLTTEGQGIISVEIPNDVESNLLQANQNYHWYLSMICNPQQRSRDLVVEGWMRQAAIDPAIETQLESLNVVEKADLYHEQGFWHDALSILVEEKNKPGKTALVTDKWSELLESVGLGDIATEPMIDTSLIEDSASLRPSTNFSSQF